MTGYVKVQTINTTDRQGRELTMDICRCDGRIISVDVYTLIPSIKIDQETFQLEVA